jgi:hypothetical protein
MWTSTFFKTAAKTNWYACGKLKLGRKTERGGLLWVNRQGCLKVLGCAAYK